MEAKIAVFLLLTSCVFAYFDVEYQNVMQISGEDFVDMTGVKVKRIPGTKLRGLYGPVIIHGVIDETVKALLNIYVKQGGEYRLMPFKIPPTPIFEGYNNDKYFVPDFLKVSNLSQPMPCPVPKTTFMINGYKATIPDALQMALQSGEYSGELNMVDKDGNVVFSAKSYIAIVNV